MDKMLACIPNDQELAAWLGKKGSVNGVTFYNRKVGDANLTVITPTNAESRFSDLANVISIADLVIISTRNLDRMLGESMIGAELIGKPTVFTDDNDISQFLLGSPIKEPDIMNREKLLEFLSSQEYDVGKEGTRILIDKAFPVKGVGTVLLGIVKGGTVRVHDQLFLSDGTQFTVRSIQVQDEDMELAAKGARVGLAVKGVDDKSIDKGEVASESRIIRARELAAKIRLSRLVKGIEMEGMHCTLVKGFSAVECTLSNDGESHRIELSKPIPFEKGEGFLLVRNASPRIFGGGEILGGE